MADNKVTIEIAIEGNAEVQFKKLSESAKTFANESKKGFDVAAASFASFAGNLAANAVAAGFKAIAAGAEAFVDVLGEAISQAAEQEVAINRLNSALQQSGQFSEEVSASLQKFAAGLQATTKYSDDSVLSATALISSLSQLDQQGLQKATQAALNLSSALGIDLQSAANLVGKAADGNVSVLGRYGIQVKETGDKAKDFANALELVNQKFGNAAASEVNTYSGAMAQLENNYNDVIKVLGEAIVQNPVLIGLTKSITSELQVLSKWVSENKEAISAFVTDGILFMIKATIPAIQTIEALYRSFQLLIGTAEIVVAALTRVNIPLNIIAKFSDTAKELRQNLLSLAGDGVDRVKNSFTEDNWLDTVGASLENIKNKTIEISQAEVSAADQKKAIRDEQIAMSQEDKDAAALEAESKAAAQEQAQANALQSAQAYLTARNEMLKSYDTKAAQDEIIRNNSRLTTIKGQVEQNYIIQNQLKKEKNKADEEMDKLRAQQQMDTLQRVASLQTAKTKELAVIGKAAAIALATIDTYKGANSALGSVPFPFNFVAAAAVITAGLVNVSNIIGTPLATGITQVPGGFQNDTFPARLTSGERVVSAPQNRDLTEFLAGSTGLTAKLDQLIAVLSVERNQSIMIDGREIVTAVQNQLDSGRAINV